MTKMCYCQEFWWRRMTTASPPWCSPRWWGWWPWCCSCQVHSRYTRGSSWSWSLQLWPLPLQVCPSLCCAPDSTDGTRRARRVQPMLSTTPSGARIDYFDIEQNISLPLQWTNRCKSVCNEDDNICRSRHRPEYVHSPQARIPWHWSWCDGGGGRSVTSHVTRDTSQGGGVVMSTGHCLSSWFIFSGSLGPSVAPSLAILARLAAANHITPE